LCWGKYGCWEIRIISIRSGTLDFQRFFWLVRPHLASCSGFFGSHQNFYFVSIHFLSIGNPVMNKTLVIASLFAAVALTACGKKEEAPVAAPAPAVEAAPAAAPAADAAPAAAPAADAAATPADSAAAAVTATVDAAVGAAADAAADAAKAAVDAAAAAAKPAQ
jgi:hypothetical protein